MTEKMISIAKEFSKVPGGRWRKDGPFSGQEVREDVLAPALQAVREKEGDVVIVSLDGVAGYGSSFLEESFGGIVRANIMPPELLRKKLQIRASDPVFVGFQHDAIRNFRVALEK